MGLDMNVYMIQRPVLDSGKVYDSNDFNDDEIVIREAEINEPLYRQIIPYCTKVQVVNHYYNLAEIGRDYGMTEVHIGGWSCDKNGSRTSFYGCKNGKNEHLTLSDDLIDSKYTIDREEICCVCVREEIRYWRKAYDIQEWFHEHISEQVENTGYYILTEEMIRAFNKRFPEDKLPVEAPDVNGALVYWEWY